MDKSSTIFTEYVNKYSNIKIQAQLDGNNARRTTAKLMLNSLYGRFGLKYEPSIIKYVHSSDIKQYFIDHEVIENFVIDEEYGIEYIKYTKAPSEVLKNVDRERYNLLKSKTNLDGEYVVRSLPISAMITSYGSIEMNPFLNLADNPCYYTDTDSLFLKNPLAEKNVGNSLGELSFKGIAKRAYFISPKTYCLVMDNDKVIVKCKGLKTDLLNEDHFKSLLAGNEISIDTSKIFVSVKKGSGGIKNMKMIIKPEINNRITIKDEKGNLETKTYHVIDGEIQSSI
jgi:hypothetical protein